MAFKWPLNGCWRINAGGNPVMDWHSIKGGVEIFLVNSCYRNHDYLYLAHMQSLKNLHEILSLICSLTRRHVEQLVNKNVLFLLCPVPKEGLGGGGLKSYELCRQKKTIVPEQGLDALRKYGLWHLTYQDQFHPQ